MPLQDFHLPVFLGSDELDGIIHGASDWEERPQSIDASQRLP